jgi:hypothetical protein
MTEHIAKDGEHNTTEHIRCTYLGGAATHLSPATTVRPGLTLPTYTTPHGERWLLLLSALLLQAV